MKDLEKLMAKKKEGKELDPAYKDAKMASLSALRDEMKKMMSDGLASPGSMKKVEVAANDKGGLVEGLDKAKDLLGNEDSEDMGDFEHESAESPEMEKMEQSSGEEDEELSPEALTHEELAQLKMLLDKMKK